MIAKLIVHAPDRASAVQKLYDALGRTAVPGIVTNIDFLRTLMSREDVKAGELDTGLIDRMSEDELAHAPAELDLLFAAVAIIDRQQRAATAAGAVTVDGADPAGASAWDRPTGWRTSRPVEVTVPLVHAGTEYEAIWRGEQARWSADGQCRLVSGGQTHRARVATAGDTVWVMSERGIFAFTRPQADTALDPGAAGADITAPMPGAVIDVRAADGAEVTAGTPVVVVEAMKMEHVLTAPADGIVHLKTQVGTQVALDEVLATIVDTDAEEDNQTDSKEES